jgi:hypothetical protein
VHNRKNLRGAGVKVIHHHRVGHHTIRRVSELVFVDGQPKAVLGWIDLAGVRMPLYIGLEPDKLRKSRALKNTYYYDETTSDPRFEDMRPLPESDRRGH